MKIRLLPLIILLLAGSQLFGQNSNSAVARIFENSSKDASKIFVTYSDGTDEILPLKNLRGYGMANADEDVLMENQKTIHNFLNGMEEKGFKISEISSSSEAFIYTLIVFVKE